MKTTIHDKYPFLKGLAEKRRQERAEMLRQHLDHITAPHEAVKYAENIGMRVPALEPLILQCDGATLCYLRDVLKCPWKDAEPAMLRGGAPDILFYAKFCIHGRWKDGESAMRADRRHKDLSRNYAKEILGRGFWGQWKFQLFGT